VTPDPISPPHPDAPGEDPANPVTKVGQQVTDRPTETVTGLALAVAVYGFLTQADLAHPASALIALAVAFVPTTISNIVDRIRGRDDA
jgi:hypothetical protein